MKFSNDVEKYEIEVTKMGQNNPKVQSTLIPLVSYIYESKTISLLRLNFLVASSYIGGVGTLEVQED